VREKVFQVKEEVFSKNVKHSRENTEKLKIGE